MNISYETYPCLSNQDIIIRKELLLEFKHKVKYRDYFNIVDVIDNYMHRFREKITDLGIFRKAVLFLCDSEGYINSYEHSELESTVALKKEMLKDLHISIYRETLYPYIIRKNNYTKDICELCINLSLDYEILKINPSTLDINNIKYVNSDIVYLTKLLDDKYLTDVVKIKLEKLADNVHKYNYNGKSVAIKTLLPDDEFYINGADVKEISLLLQLKHENIINMIGYYLKGSTFKIIFDYVDTSLDKIELKDMKFDYFKQLLAAVSYLHSNNIVHCDIKPVNIMVKDGCIKLIDFGLSYLYYADLDKMDGLSATTCFITPVDVLLGNKYYGFDLDIWGCGVCLYYILTKAYPFYYFISNATPTIYIHNIFRTLGSPTDEQWSKISYSYTKDDFPEYKFVGFDQTEYNHLLYKMFSYIPKDRPSVNEVIEMVN